MSHTARTRWGDRERVCVDGTAGGMPVLAYPFLLPILHLTEQVAPKGCETWSLSNHSAVKNGILVLFWGFCFCFRLFVCFSKMNRTERHCAKHIRWLPHDLSHTRKLQIPLGARCAPVNLALSMLRRVGEDFEDTLGYKHSLQKEISSSHMMWNHDFKSLGTGVLQDEGKLDVCMSWTITLDLTNMYS